MFIKSAEIASESNFAVFDNLLECKSVLRRSQLIREFWQTSQEVDTSYWRSNLGDSPKF